MLVTFSTLTLNSIKNCNRIEVKLNGFLDCFAFFHNAYNLSFSSGDM